MNEQNNSQRKFEVKEVEQVNYSELPELIQNQFKKLKKLKENVDIATQKAQNAQKSANEAKSKSLGILKNKDAISSIQTATVDLAEAQISQAEGQKISFEYQQKLGEITKYLFNLGISNIANNRKVVEEIRKKMENASEEEMDEFQKQEFENVIKQLMAQEDIMIKQQKLSNHVKEHDEKLAEKTKKDEIQDKEIALQEAKDEEHDRLIAERMKKDEKQDEEIARQAQKVKELENLIFELQNENKQKGIHSDVLKKKCEELTNELGVLNKKFENFTLNATSEFKTKAAKNEIYISYVLSVIAIIMAFVQFIL